MGTLLLFWKLAFKHWVTCVSGCDEVWSLKLSVCLSVGGQVSAGLSEGQHRAGLPVGDQGRAPL